MWGQVFLPRTTGLRKGIIPTRVGTRWTSSYSPSEAQDHPHACGDKCYCGTIVRRQTGSSPRVWGQADFVLSYTEVAGIIPTRVGTRILECCTGGIDKDHPHACGDKSRYHISVLGLLGSSPRVWGQVDVAYDDHSGIRIIPTRVGTSIGSASFRGRREDHPHACGDKKPKKTKRICV